MRIFVSIILAIFLANTSAYAQTPKRYASIVVDADTHEIIHARQIKGQRYPASLTKVMTLYLTFDAINNGILHPKDKLKISRRAAATPPVGIGLRAGATITVEQAIQALTVRSANDAAVVLAERLAGSEEAFSAMMTAKARELHMQHTVFKTANGLPHPEQTTTARDMAKLATFILSHHRRYYHYFGQTHFTFNGRVFRNTNSLLHWVDGVDGFKTGFTNASGYNLIISAERDGRRIIAVVLGGASGKSRDQHMVDLIERSFRVLRNRPAPVRRQILVHDIEPKKINPQTANVPTAVRLRGRGEELVSVTQGTPGLKIAGKQYDSSWSIQVGAFATEAAARAQILSVAAHPSLDTTRGRVMPWVRGPKTYFRARFAGLTAAQAQDICQSLPHLKADCLVIAPGS